MAMLEVKDINVYYGLIHALRDVSFEVNEGEVVALIGANGAGKTTTLHTVTGLLPSKGGTVTFEGKDITHKPGHCKARHEPRSGGPPRVRGSDGRGEPAYGRVYPPEE